MEGQSRAAVPARAAPAEGRGTGGVSQGEQAQPSPGYSRHPSTRGLLAQVLFRATASAGRCCGRFRLRVKIPSVLYQRFVFDTSKRHLQNLRSLCDGVSAMHGWNGHQKEPLRRSQPGRHRGSSSSMAKGTHLTRVRGHKLPRGAENVSSGISRVQEQAQLIWLFFFFLHLATQVGGLGPVAPFSASHPCTSMGALPGPREILFCSHRTQLPQPPQDHHRGALLSVEATGPAAAGTLSEQTPLTEMFIAP